jgi:thiol-disulfide isomerase/thioredoxin
MSFWRTFFFILCFYAGHASGDEVDIPQGIIVLSGDKAPALVLTDLDGNRFDLQSQRGRWVFVHFWASWCGPCRKEMPTIQRMASQLESDKFKVVLVNTAEDDDRVFSFIGIVAPDLTPLMDYDGQVTEHWQPRGLPSTFLIDPQGRRRYLALGGRKWDSPEFMAFLQQLIGKQ